MNLTNFYKIFSVVVFGALVFAVSASADHSWGSYHWGRAGSPLNLKLGDNVSSVWDGHLTTASNDWNASTTVKTAVVSGSTRPKNCRPTSGRVEVCNAKFGSNGWLGIASVWVSGDHITQGTVKLNDTYFSTPTYNTSAWRQFVVCQEVGHTFGLDHQDEIFSNANLGTCMDYTDDPDGAKKNQLSNLRPNLHDFAQLELIYSHFDSSTTAKQDTSASPGRSDEALEGPAEWGKVIRRDTKGQPSLYVRDLGKNEKLFTFVVWAS